MPRYLDSLLRQEEHRYRSTSQELRVEYNDDLLLSVSRATTISAAECIPQEWDDGLTVDLRTGRRLSLTDLLGPGTEARLRRLLVRRLPTSLPADSFPRLPQGGFCVVPDGLRFVYDRRDVPSLCCPTSSQPMHTLQATLSFAELRPLVPPGSPLARVLRQRGLLTAPAARRLPRYH